MDDSDRLKLKEMIKANNTEDFTSAQDLLGEINNILKTGGKTSEYQAGGMKRLLEEVLDLNDKGKTDEALKALRRVQPKADENDLKDIVEMWGK